MGPRGHLSSPGFLHSLGWPLPVSAGTTGVHYHTWLFWGSGGSDGHSTVKRVISDENTLILSTTSILDFPPFLSLLSVAFHLASKDKGSYSSNHLFEMACTNSTRCLKGVLFLGAFGSGE